MKLSEFLTESEFKKYYPYGAANTELDLHYNPEIVLMNNLQHRRYKTLKTEHGETPVVTEEPKNPANQNFRTEPTISEPESPGYRGKQKALARAGAKYKPFKEYDPYDLRRGQDNPFGPPNLFNS